MNRRDCLKTAAVVLAGSAAYGCSERDAGGQGASAIETSTHGTGTVPIADSGWVPAAGELPGYPALQQDIRADVAVIGAGLAGSSLALHLAEAGINVVVLEARQPGWGASGRNAGHVLPILKDRSVFDRFPDGGKAFLEIFRQHHAIPFELSKQHGITCDAVQAGYLNAMTSKGTFDDFRQQSRYLETELGQRVQALDAEGMAAMTGSRYYSHGVLYEAGGRINPYLFTNGMIAAAVSRGAAVYGNSEALTLVKSDGGWRVGVANGSVTADRVAFCTNAYPTAIVPEFRNSFYPLTAYALSTKPLPDAALELIMPSRATLAQVPVDLNPFVVDGRNRIITSSIPSVSKPEDARWHFQQHLAWIHRTWPATKDMDIQLEHYWTGRVALRDQEFPGFFELVPGVYGLMHFNAWGNVMAPLMGMLVAKGIAADAMDGLPFPIDKPRPVACPNKQKILISQLLIPAARVGQRLGII